MCFSHHLLSRGWRAAVLLVAVACLNTDRASAGCGDYVTILNASPNASQQTDGHDGRTDPTDRLESPVPTKPPCHGPNCSGSPSKKPSPLAPPVPVGSRAKELTQPLGSICVPQADPAGRVDSGTLSSRPISRPTSI